MAIDIPEIFQNVIDVDNVNSANIPNNNVYNKTNTFYNLYEKLVQLVKGTNYTEQNWILLLTKTMSIVNELKGVDMAKNDKVELTAELVFHFIEEHTNIQHVVYQDIRDSIYGLINTMISNNSINKKQHDKTKKNAIMKVLNIPNNGILTPFIITTLLEDKLLSLIKDKDGKMIDLLAFKTGFPSIVLSSISFLDEIIEKYNYYTGVEKKNFIIQSLNNVVKTHIIESNIFNLTESNKQSLEFLLSGLPLLIDTISNVANGKTKMSFDNNHKQNIFTCISKAFTLFLARKG